MMKMFIKHIAIFVAIIVVGLSLNLQIYEYLERFQKEEPSKKIIVYKKIYVKVPYSVPSRHIPIGEKDTSAVSNSEIKTNPHSTKDVNLYKKSKRFHKTGLISSLE